MTQNTRTPPEVVEAFASAVNTEDLLRDALKDVGVIRPDDYSSVIELTLAFTKDVLPRYKPAPMLPITLWCAWKAAHDAGIIWDKHFRKDNSRTIQGKLKPFPKK